MAIETREALAPRSIVEGLPRLEVLAQDTSYDPNDIGPFQCREGFEMLAFDDDDLDAAETKIAVMQMLRGLKDDPDLAYVRAVTTTILEDLLARRVLTQAEYEVLDEAPRLAAEHGAEFVARKWLSQRAGRI